ncbi:MAG: bifunctional [glutamine synthetase] adenylyltransferase/[glutamine synthetase]-adenylyl-L-tyrosine phosphorylase [Alphaproteobacteria bacterium]|nr:bifunctional [glutamine synthetase] adenylyltransferase/[glutamine synthetase]-adenylyl-L-tyrosine phosphorylase [Alphaproteobacteria bacterium]
MGLLSDFSRPAAAPPQPADARLQDLGFTAWETALAEAADPSDAARARAWAASEPGRALLAAAFGNSPFLSRLVVAEWPLLLRCAEQGPDAIFEEIAGAIEQRTDPDEDQAALMRRLRIAKRRTALVAGIAELAGSWSLEQQMAALSRFAEAAIGAAVRHLLRTAARRGTLRLADPNDPERDSGLIVLGMGKLGGGELNYSSDIDLILLFDSAQNASPPPADAQAFFPRLARDLVRILDERTGDGYVFRTDLRLRPDPRSTPLALSTAAALSYYESVGQNWERAALIKARPVAGDRAAGARFLGELQPFIWRKNLDFAAIADIHSIKRQIQAYKGGGRIAVEGHDIKTGRGGIREIEFFAQTQQLIWGGRLRALRAAPTCTALQRLAATGRIDPATAETLIADYRFLRRVEHRLQMVDDAQVHRLPADRDGIGRLAIFLGYANADAFAAELCNHLASVERHYAELFEEAPSLAQPGNLVFTGAEDDPDTLQTLARLGFAEPPRVAEMVRGWHHGHMRATRSQRAREILTELVPELLRTFGATANPDTALLRFDHFLSHLPAGVQLFSLLHANPGLLSLVADIMAEAPRLAERLAQRPALLDSVLTAEFSAALPDCSGLAADLGALIAGARDFQDVLDIIRRWAEERRFQVGVQLLRRDIEGARTGMALADIAETALGALLPAVIGDFARVHGRVPGGAFAIVALGRLGSREMSLASDLDLILIYDAPDDGSGSDGPRPLPIITYYARLSQRLISAITAPTAEGKLYEVDMRLRPSGASGPIASSLAAFAQYQHESAWTWEHMALTRARPVAGDAALQRRIRAATATVLCQPRDLHRLVTDVADMRRRVAESVPRPSSWDLRNRRGGLIDLEFTVQYLMLREAARRPELLQRETGAALSALAEAGVLPPQGLRELSDALSLLRHLRALLALLFDGVPDAKALAGPAGATLARCAGAVDFPWLDADMVAACARVRAWYERLIARPARRIAASRQQMTEEAAR